MEYEAGRSDELAEGAMRLVELAGEKVLLARVGGRCHAVGALCPHMNGPLEKGVLHGGVVTCPWHKATFDVASGARLEPPSRDDLPRHGVREEGGTIHVTLGAPMQRTLAEPDARCFVILGAGAAGMSAAQAMREEGFGGRVVMVGREEGLPYDRTLLSKGALSGEDRLAAAPLHEEAFFETNRIELRHGVVAEVLPQERTVRLEDGTALHYDSALLALGGTPKPLDVPGGRTVRLLRSSADARTIQGALGGAKRAVLVGGGFIGMEAAGSLRERGLEVTVVAEETVPLAGRLGEPVAAALKRLHEGKGVVFRTGKVVAVEDGRRVVLDDGSMEDGDLVLAGTGIAPATGPVRDIALRRDGGVDVDAGLRAAEALYAAGDLAAFPLGGDGERVRVEHWRVAEQHGRVAALGMMGQAAVYDAVPYFWTIHYKKRLDYVGHAEDWDELVIDGDPDALDFAAFYVKNGAVAAVSGMGRDKAMARCLYLLQDRQAWSQAALLAAMAGG